MIKHAQKSISTQLNFKKTILNLLLALILVIPATAQDPGKITGIVVDSKTGETLIGANVIIEGTLKGSQTDLDGHYSINTVEPGTYNIVVSYISYLKQTITGVVVEPGEIVKLDVALEPESEFLDEVVVTAQAVRDNESALLSKRAKSIAFSNAVSTETIRLSGAGDAAAAVKSISGATVQEGKYVLVRGLGGRYSNSQLNGSNLPSADPDRNSAQLDLFPSELLDNVEIKKTFTPDQPGSFSGGNVNINTKSFPIDFILNVTSGISYNQNANLNDSFLLGPVSNTDWLGYDNGTRAVPDVISNPDVVIPREQFARRDPILAAQLDEISKSFNNQMRPTQNERDPGFNNNLSATVGNQFKLFGRPLGYIISGTYDRSYAFYQDGENNQYVATSPEGELLTPDFDFDDTRGTETANSGLMANVNYMLTNNHQIGFNFFRNQNGTNMGRYQVGNFLKNSPSPNVFFESYVVEYTERNVESFQFRGKHFFPKLLNVRLNWDISLTDTQQEQPDLRFFFNQYVNVVRPDTSFRVYDINLGSSNATLPTRLFRDLNETNNQYKADLEIPFDLGLTSTVRFKTGFSFENKDRVFRERKFDYNTVGVNFTSFNGDVEAFFSPEAVGIIDTTNSGLFRFGNVIRDGSIPRNSYDGTQQVTAFYGMIDIPLFEKLRLVGGARLESTDIEIISADSSLDAGILNTDDILPSVNIIYAINNEMNLRLSGSQTLARPTFREIAPFSAFNFAGGRVINGNPNLKRTLIQNYDIRWEWFSRVGEIVAVSGFYKKFENPIERVIISNNNQETYQNVDNGELFGIELELRKRLDFIYSSLRNFTLSTNIAFIRSEVDVPARELEFAEGFNIDDIRPLQGQSDYVLNTVLSYQNPKKGTQVSLSYNRFGERLINVGLGGTPNIFEQGRNDVFFSVSQRFLSILTAKFSVANLLDDDYLTSQNFKGNDFTDSRFRSGRTFQLSIAYNF